MKNKSQPKKIKKVADDELDIDTKVDPTAEEDEEEEEDAEGEDVAPQVDGDEEAAPVAAEGEDEEECEACGDEGDMEADADEDIVDVSPDQVTPVAADDDGDEDADDLGGDEDEGEEEEEDAEGEEGVDEEDEEDEDDAEGEIPDVSPDEVEPVAAEGEDDEDAEDGEDDVAEEDAEGEEDEGAEDGEDEDVAEEEEEDAEGEIPDVTQDDVAPVAAEDESLDDDAKDEDEAAGEEDEEEEEDAEGEEEEDKVPAPALDATASVVIEPIYETDVDIKSANLEMALFGPDSKDPHWVVFNNGDPLCKISLSSQENPEDVRENFISEGYQGNLLESIRELATASKPTSPIEVLSQVGAKFYYAAVQKSKLAEMIKAQESKRVTERLASANDSYNDQLHQNMTMVVTAHAKNFYKEPDAFKVELVTSLKKAGIEADVAAGIVESAFLNSAPAWFNRVIAKAKEYCAYTPEALKEIKAALEDAGQKEVDYDASEELAVERTKVASTESRKPSAGVPLTTNYRTSVKTASSDRGEFGDRVRSSIASLRRGRRG
jgi:hypothetical protein